MDTVNTHVGKLDLKFPYKETMGHGYRLATLNIRVTKVVEIAEQTLKKET